MTTLEVLTALREWQAHGKAAALVTVVRTWGSAPRPAGSKMAVSEAAEMAGSVSAGCVEGAVVEAALEVLRSGVPRRIEFGVSDESAWQVGLACGGQIELFVESAAPLLGESAPGQGGLAWVEAALASGRPALRAVRIGGPPDQLGRSLWAAPGQAALGSLGAALDRLAAPAVEAALAGAEPGLLALDPGRDPAQVFLDLHLPPAELVIVGGVHIAVTLAHLARALGYRVTIVEPRRAFAAPERFPDADRVLTEWPDEALRAVGLTHGTAVAALSHDPKIDDPALVLALASPAFYVGALGSRRTQALRRARLLEAGLTPVQLARLRGPIGLDLGGREPEEIALSVLAEIVAARAGRLPPPGPPGPAANRDDAGA